MAKKRYYSSGAYEGMESRRAQETADGGMIKEDRSAIANLPQNVMIKAYPKVDPYGVYHLNDTIKGVDRQMSDDGEEKKTGEFPEKY